VYSIQNPHEGEEEARVMLFYSRILMILFIFNKLNSKEKKKRKIVPPKNLLKFCTAGEKTALFC
jgi:hypothetical protein